MDVSEAGIRIFYVSCHW